MASHAPVPTAAAMDIRCRSSAAARKRSGPATSSAPDGRGTGFSATQIGKINVTDFHSYVAVERGIAREAVKRLS